MSLIVNLWHLKNTNGMYWYALDYIRGLEGVVEVLVRSELLPRAEDDLRGLVVRRLSFFQYLRIYFTLLFSRRKFLYTPTPHPLPFLKRQMIILHDPYPFLVGRLAFIKRWLFFFGVLSSRATIGVVNRSGARAFVSHLPTRCKIIDAPNRIGEPLLLSQHKSAELTVGLLGADSPKKRYEELFDSFRRNPIEKLTFLVYGHETAYLNKVIAEYPDIPLKVAFSDEVSLKDFFEQISCVVSVSKGEGFSRLVALALVSGVEIFLTNDPVYAEFYSGSTDLYKNTEELVTALARRGLVFDSKACPTAFSETYRYCSENFDFACRYLMSA